MRHVTARLFDGRGEMRARCRGLDWSATVLGPVDRWAVPLRTATAIVLGSAFPMILVWGRELVQIYNDAYLPLIGAKHPRALGMPTHECWPEIRHVQEPIFDRVFGGETVSLVEAPYPLDRNGSGALETAYFDATFSPVPLEDGRVGGSISTLFESTSRRQARAASAERERLLAASEAARRDAEAARQDAEAANRAKGEFLAVMSHELRTPLNAIGGYAELLELGIRGPVSEAQRTDLARIQVAQRHLLGLVTDVLNFVRIEAGTVQYSLRDVRVDEVVSALESLVGPQFRRKGIAYETAACDPALRVRADREKLEQILVNLLTNALKFTDPGGGVRVECEASDERVAICVRDTGLGIAADRLVSVFEPFVQVDQRLTRTREGVGLGLAISRDLARGMGATLTVRSTPGEGSTFTVALPRVAG